MFVRLVLMLVIVAAVGGGLFKLKMNQFAAMKAQFSVVPPPTEVTTAEVQKESWQRSLFAVGSFAAFEGIDVTTQVPGQIEAIHFDSGQHVQKGDVLVTLDTSVDVAELAALAAESKWADLQYERAAKLLKDRTFSQSQFDEAAARRDQANAVALAKRASIAKKTIRAPFSGTLGIRMVDVGQYLKEGASIVPLQRLSPIYLNYRLPERYFDALKLGQKVEVTVQAYPEEKFKGTVTAMDPGVDNGTRSIRLQATLENPDARLRPGMFAEVKTIQPTVDEVLTIPETAITYSPYGDSVFVVEGGGEALTVTRKQIEVGENRGQRVAVTNGLSLGERIVTVGQNKLRNGMPVKPVAAAATPGADAGRR